jgi:hypothetical protein
MQQFIILKFFVGWLVTGDEGEQLGGCGNFRSRRPQTESSDIEQIHLHCTEMSRAQ